MSMTSSVAAPGPAPQTATIAGPEITASCAFVDDQLRRVAGGVGVVAIAVPAPVVAPDVLLRGATTAPWFLWEPGEGGSVFAGLGACQHIDLDGEARFASLRRASDAHFEHLETVSYPGCRPASARFFGGLAFAPGASRSAPWTRFGDGGFTLPRWRYETDGAEASLMLAVHAAEVVDGRHRSEWLEALTGHLETLHAAVGRALVVPETSAARDFLPPSREGWRTQVEAIRAAISSGRFAKIVAAHRFEVNLHEAIDPRTVLRRLALGLRASTRFAFARDAGQFLGATPERLIARHGAAIVTEALAGSIESGARYAERLLASVKDRHEHTLVIEPIVRRLEPLCERLDVAAEPRVRTLSTVQHLHTPITGTLRATPFGALPHVLDLVEVLHPTPAVGGVPTDDAMGWIARHEPFERGWYAGPIGWFDASGDGEFAVALRGCVLASDRAYLYAGGGIVADSDPDLEYRETELKQHALLAALGVSRRTTRNDDHAP